MKYSIKDLNQEWISKNLVYESIKNSLPLSNNFVKNKRFFTDKDLEVLQFCKQFGVLQTVSKYWTSQGKGNNDIYKNTVSNSIEQKNEQSENNLDSLKTEIEKTVSKEVNTAIKQFEDEKTVLLKEIEQKENIIKIKEDQAQKYAILKVEEEKEKKERIEKYEQVTEEKGDWMKRFYWLKTYLIVFIVLFCLSLLFLALIFFGSVKI